MMGNMFRSALFKLTAIYVAIVMAISLTFSFALYHLAVRELQTGFQNQYTQWLTEYRPYGLRQPGNPSSELQARSERIYLQLAYLNSIVFICTAIISYLIARRTLRPIERAHEQQKRFTADVSHELRTPLTALKMDTEVTLLDKKASAKVLRATLESNLEEALRMENLVNNLLQLASLEANQIRTEFSILNMKELVQKSIGIMNKYALSKSILVTADLKDLYVNGDASSLTELCVILLDNAIKYSNAHTTVTIILKKTGQHVRLEVKDNGTGIPTKDLPHIFDRFYRADKSRNEITGGYGLGLSLAKLIADLHNGEIILTSKEGQGTQAVVILPAVSSKHQ